MPTLWLFDIEPHEQRYTSEWHTELPRQLQKAMAAHHAKQWQLRVVSGGKTSGTVSAGAFINFAETNEYKATQTQNFSAFLGSGQVKDGDRVLFADAWHPGVIQCRYMADLVPSKFDIDVMWHAGSYDPNDFLGRTQGVKQWSLEFERSIYNAASRNYFATRYHKFLFLNRVKPNAKKSARVVGWPMEYLAGVLSPYAVEPKSNIILFPHRLAPEKQNHINPLMRSLLPQYDILEAQKIRLPKADYRKLVGSAAAVISYSKQETLGIGVYEGLLCGAVPIMPHRLSYKEIYPSHCYPSTWTNTGHVKPNHAQALADLVRDKISNRNQAQLQRQAKRVGQKYFNGEKLYATVLR